MVKTRRKNYISYRDDSGEPKVPVHLKSKKTSPKVTSSINLLDFSTEILTKITCHLSFDSLRNFRLACRRLNDIGIAVLIQRSSTIIKKYGELVKFSPSNVNPDVDACCVLQYLCLLEKDMKNHGNTAKIFFPIMILDKATELLSLMSRKNVEDLSLKEEQAKILVQLIHKKRCNDYNSTLAPSQNSKSYTKVNKHAPITYP
ncbi:hypothetical protein TSAR_008403 [Trichomalopsis sarcophagae]|uniref:F-box domain-containing protein n=1 Tax=Trichomalopsis sarcophagae TaxID=543379 RepID=A0A232EU73_9HYME|nr:hypothetical protein TSAR_008403 [Trichomalopsis sarcophagae]